MHAARTRLARGRLVEARSENGFTIVEMVVAVGIMALVLTALASVLGASLRTLAVAKTRSQANDVVTQGIEDLHRFPFNSLGECFPPSAPPPGLSNTVYLANCPGSASVVPYEDPCNGWPGTVPLESYTCTRNGIGYSVKRYVAWADAGQTTKRLAVFASWTDQAGTHN